MQLTNFIWLAAAVGTSAHPSGHAHRHRAFHDANEKRGLQFFKAEHPATTIVTTVQPTTTSTPTPTPTPSTSSSSASSPSSSSSSSSSGYKDFCSGSSKRATAGEIAYTGNTGSTWGCNIMLVDESIANQYDYTTTYKNVANEEYEVVCFNKIGPDGGINGFFGYSAVTFSLAAGASQVVAFQANSQGACAFGPSSVPKTSVGEWAGTWVEFDFADSANNNWSGADCSSLVSQSAGLTVYGCQVCYDGTCSTILPGGSQSTNAYVQGDEAADGLGLNIPAGNVALSVSVGYSG